MVPSVDVVADLYQLTMAASYVLHEQTDRATFSLFARHLPPRRNFLVAAGLEDVLARLEDFAIGDGDLTWLAANGFDERTVAALAGLEFTGDVFAVPEGTLILADEPLIEVTAPLPEAQLVETMVLNQITYQTALTTKAARCMLAADGRAELIDFSLRRTHGIEAGMAAARAATIAGFAGTSNVAASAALGLPAVGTMAHSYVESFPDERSAFRSFAGDFPSRTTFLVDTYDTLAGIDAAIAVAEQLALRGRFGVRLDSGDLLALSVQARRRLDEAGHTDARIVASGGLDEYDIVQLLDHGAPIDVFGIGTKFGVSADAPSLDSAYKLVEYAGRPVMKLSAGKETLPGPKQVFRRAPLDDVLGTRDEPQPQGTAPLLQPVMRNGARTEVPTPLSVVRDDLAQRLAELPAELRQIRAAQPPSVAVSDRLARLRDSTKRLHLADLQESRS
ncbi:MAG: nicotinate phosphoribosyltransferase [Acidimicrobiia bacterium]|nr:nicotinate phosphoribosyltransferase [Acidimicrobiia bacterium]